MNSLTSKYQEISNCLATMGTLSFSIGIFSLSHTTVVLTITEELNQLTTEFNTLLDQEINTLNSTLPGSNISLLDCEYSFR
jgi:predicted PurR-regulated permease PerM